MNTESKNNSKMKWIIGGIAALILIVGVLLVALAGGIYFYYTIGGKKEPIAAKKKPESTEPAKKKKDEIAIELPLPKEKQSEEFVEFVKEEYSRLGTFRLYDVKAVKSRYFSQADFVLGAQYSEAKSNSMIVHTYSHY